MENKTTYSKEQISKEILEGLEDNRAYICCQDLESGEMDAYSFLGSFFKSRHVAKFRLSHILLPVSPTVEEKPDGYIVCRYFHVSKKSIPVESKHLAQPVYFSPVSPSEKTIEEKIIVINNVEYYRRDYMSELIQKYSLKSKTIESDELLNKIFDDLEKNAVEPEFYKYWIKQANQIIRKHIAEYFSVSAPESVKIKEEERAPLNIQSDKDYSKR